MTSTSTNCARNSTNSRSRRRKADAPPREERIIAGFEEIQRFVEKHGRAPQHGEDRDIFERLYAVRLDRLRALEECRSLLAPLDHQGLLSGAEIAAAAPAETIDEDELLAELEGAAGAGRHHRTAPRPHERREARRRGNRQSRTSARTSRSSSRFSSRCRGSLKSGVRTDAPVQNMDEIKMAEIRRASSSLSAVRSPMSPRWARISERNMAVRDSRLACHLSTTEPRAIC